MAKWNVVLSTTEPYNYVGMIQVRQGNKNSEVMEATITENGMPYDLTGCKVYFESVVGDKYPVQLGTKVIDAKKGKIQYTFDQHSMQCLHRQTADFIIYKEDELIATTQDFSYFVIKAVSKTEGEMGSYWQTVEDLIADMTDFINENKGDFTDWMNERKEEFERWRQEQEHSFQDWREDQKSDYLSWFESIKDILKTIDPGGRMLAELVDARVDIQGVRHDSISERLLADMNYLYQKLEKRLYTLGYGEISELVILQDNAFSSNHETEIVGTVDYHAIDGALVIATVDDTKQNTYMLEAYGAVLPNEYTIGESYITGTYIGGVTKARIAINGTPQALGGTFDSGLFKYYVGANKIKIDDQVTMTAYDINNRVLESNKSIVVRNNKVGEIDG
ncbi:hypothetical protein EB14_02275 [Enterococcus faecium]|nr:hypothetical protein EB14_02275 [Enterococcus faecium]